MFSQMSIKFPGFFSSKNVTAYKFKENFIVSVTSLGMLKDFFLSDLHCYFFIFFFKDTYLE